MSSPNETTITCRECGTEAPFTLWESINVILEPEKKRHLLDGSLTRFVCHSCGAAADIVYPLLYHDMEARLMVWLWPEEGDPEAAALPIHEKMTGYCFRIVETRNDLTEKILIKDAGLDDRVVELLKHIVKTRSAKGPQPVIGELRFLETSKDPKGTEFVCFQHFGDEACTSINVPREAYTALAHSLAGFPNSMSWVRVDRRFAKELLENLE